MADTWEGLTAEQEGLTAEQWAATSLCDGWSVHVTAGHILTAAEQTITNFYKQFGLAGFRFNVFADRAGHRLAEVAPTHMVRRLRARTTTTNHPPAPVVVMLGEIVVPGTDLRRPLGLAHTVDGAAQVVVGRGDAVNDLGGEGVASLASRS